MKRRRLQLRIPVQFKFVRWVLLFVIVSFFVNAYTSIKMLAVRPIAPNADMVYFSSQLNFGAILLIFLVTLTFVLHRGFGALSRIEDVLDQVIKGNHSLRLKLRKGDTLIPLTDRINKLIELLEKKPK
ncbi:MAG: hypothetical protein WC412_08710 [Candidatus Omnitrophota bacterium]